MQITCPQLSTNWKIGAEDDWLREQALDLVLSSKSTHYAVYKKYIFHD